MMNKKPKPTNELLDSFFSLHSSTRTRKHTLSLPRSKQAAKDKEIEELKQKCQLLTNQRDTALENHRKVQKELDGIKKQKEQEKVAKLREETKLLEEQAAAALRLAQAKPIPKTRDRKLLGSYEVCVSAVLDVLTVVLQHMCRERKGKVVPLLLKSKRELH